MKKGLKILLITVGVIVGLILLINILAGPIIKAYVEKHSVELCHRKVTIKHVRVNLFTGKVAIIGLKAQEENGKDKFLSFKKLKVRVSLPRLLGKTVRVNRILLDGLDGHVVQDGIRFNFSDIIDFYTKDEDKKEKPDKGPSLWKVDIRNIELRNCAVLYEDLRVGSRFDTKHVSAKVPRLDLEGGPSHIDLVTDFKDGSAFNLAGDYNIKEGDFDANVKMQQLSLDLALPYLKKLTSWGKLSGILNGDAKVIGNVKRIEDMVFSGTMALNNVKATNADKSPLASFSAFEVNMNKMDLDLMEFDVSSVSLKDLVFHYDVYEDGNTLSRLQKHTVQTDSSAVAPAQEDTIQSQDLNSSDIHYLLKKLSLTNGKIVYTDHTVAPQEQTFEVSGIEIHAEDMRNGSNYPISLKANLGSLGELLCDANLDVLNLSNAEVDISIRNLKITDFNPYSLYYLAYPIEDGLLNFTSYISVKDNWLDSQNALDIFKPTFGKRDKSIKPAAAKIPMKTAMYVITDRKGHVKMDLPVKGDISSPEFSFRKVIWKTFLNLVVKIAASPVDFIAKAVAGDETFKPMLMPADQMLLNIEQTHQLGGISDFMKEREQMQIIVNVCPPQEEPSQTKAEQCYRLVKDQLVKQGIAANRIAMGTECKSSDSKDYKVEFNLNMEE